ncbi:DUF4935 domain-containing protein [Paenibacillus sp. LMG 31459]|uniref:DUF4935 domain-containing protein n=1 Tax=Paenibacillus phytohabitans TaxID=2654978 RepID=A0ABX1YV11_9BACL|nr:PIN domain-containing protein [Paenibacillus phytohabitans]NOU83901.1 DUF4935 domain-containing protein [Paenibacillus phytohabitans]
MDLVLDTNIFRENFKMDSIHFQNLFDYLVKTNSKIIVPEIVLLEVESLFERELLKRLEGYKKASRSLRNWLFTSEYSENDVPLVEEAVASFMDFFKTKLKLDPEAIFATKDEYLKEVLRRAVKHIKPCSDRGEEFRDTILWLSVLDIAKVHADAPIGFISNNTNEFSSDNKMILHPMLQKDVTDANITVYYYNSLQEFIKQHAQNIQTITKEMILSKIHLKYYANNLIDYLNDWYDDQLIDYVEYKDYQPSECHASKFTSELLLGEFFIYERTDGALYIELELSGELELRANIEIEYEDEEIDYEYDYDNDLFSPLPKLVRRTRVRETSKVFYPKVIATVGVTFDQEVMEWNEVVDIDIE